MTLPANGFEYDVESKKNFPIVIDKPFPPPLTFVCFGAESLIYYIHCELRIPANELENVVETDKFWFP